MSATSIGTTVSTVATAKADVQAKTATRLLFVDNIRILLTVLVLLHHLMIIYAGSGSWGLYTEGRQDILSGVLGTWFCASNQAYFMGLFLLISAYFVPGSVERKGAGRFVKDRLIRLGIPLALYSWIIEPVTRYLIPRLTGGEGLVWWQYIPGVRNAFLGAGPLWFVELLLLLCVGYVLWRRFFRRQPVTVVDSPFPSNRTIALFALLMGLVTFVVHLWLPMGWEFTPLNLQFPYFALYIAMFVVGLMAYRRNWLLNLPEATGKFWLRIAAALVMFFVPLAVAGGAMETNEPFLGGWHWQSLAYCWWESFLCVSMCIGLVYLFRRRVDRQGQGARFLSANAYAAYILHGVVITAVALLMRDLDLYPLLKFVLASAIALPLIFGLSSLIRKLPGAERVL